MSKLVFGDTNALLIDVSGIPEDAGNLEYGAVVAHHAPKKVDWREGQYHLAESPCHDEIDFLEKFTKIGPTGVWGNRTLANRIVELGLVPESFQGGKGILFLGTLFAEVRHVVHYNVKPKFEEKYGLYVSILWWETTEDNVDLDDDRWRVSEISLHDAFSLPEDGDQELYHVLVLSPDPSGGVTKTQIPLFAEEPA